MDTHEAPGGPRSARRPVLLAVGVGGVTVLSIACAQVIAWAQVAMRTQYHSVDLLVSVALWAQPVGLFLAALRRLRINARRSGLLLFVAVWAFLLLALGMPVSFAVLLVGAASLVAVQGGTTRGELAAVSGLEPGRAQAIASAVSAFGLAAVVGGLAALSGSGVGVLFFTMAGACVIGACFILDTFPRASETLAPTVRVRLARPSGPALRGYALSALSSGTTTACLTPLAAALKDHGFGGPVWLAVSWAGSIPAGLALTLWAKRTDTRADKGARPAAVWQLAGAVLTLGAVLDPTGYGWWIVGGLVVLNVGRFAYDASLFALRPGPQSGTALMLSAALGSAAFGTVAQYTLRIGVPHLWVSVIAAAACLLVTLARPLTVAPVTS